MTIGARGFRGFGRYLAHLVGDHRRELKGRTPVTDCLRGHVSDEWVAGLSWGQYDYLERTLAAVLGALRADTFLRRGYTLRPWRPSSARQPGVRKVDGHGRLYEWDHRLGGWMDHPYRLTRMGEDGRPRECFISEPYALGEDGLRSLVALADAGWAVDVTAEGALHYPGSTLRICLARKEDL